MLVQPDDTPRLLVFIDETGHEELADLQHPVFGLGGCCCLATHYHADVVEPWRRAKAATYGDPDHRAHATGARFTQRQMRRLGRFFRDGAFYRIATVLTRSTDFDSLGLITYYESTAAALLDCCATVADRAAATDVELTFEASQRGDRLVRAFMRRARLANSEIPYTIRSKTEAEQGLEVADFVMHAAGRHARAHEVGGRDRGRDFQAVFDDCAPELVDFRELTKARVVRNPFGTVPGIWVPHGSEPIDE